MRDPEKKRGPFTLNRLYLVVAVVIALLFLFSGKNATETTWLKFRDEMLLERDVEKITVVNKETVEIYLRKESLSKEKYKPVAKGIFGNLNPGPHYYFTIGSVEVFEKQLEEAQKDLEEDRKIGVQYIQEQKGISYFLFTWILPLLLLILFWRFVLSRFSAAGGPGSSLFDFGKSRPELYEKGKTKEVTFKDVAGYEEAKTELLEIVEFLKQPQNFTRLGAKIPKGILLVGPPGTGKTFMAKAVAGEAGVPFFSLSGSEFIEMFVGVGASRVRDLFNKAKERAPSIIFIDEIDTIGKIRGKAITVHANDERDSTLNQLLSEMDGFGPNTGVIVLAATNRADILDPALLRAGRFDRHIHLDLPNKQERVAIFNVHLKPLVLAPEVDAGQLASQTPGFSGADIANVCNEAALFAARKKKGSVDPQDFQDAVDRVVSGLEKKSKLISPGEKKIISYHEAGHAIVSWTLKHVDPLQKVTIIPRGKALGGAWYLPEERQIITRSQFYDQLSATLGGRAAEEIAFNEVSSGALDDLEKATKLSYMMVAQLGLSEKLGNISFYDSSGLYENALQKPFSEATSQLIDEEVRKLISQAYDRAKDILTSKRDKLDELAELLLKKEIVYTQDLETLLGKRM